ncbi:ThiF family adenylyltransferase [Sulfurospirillum sp. UCH001]|uniref:ThiF family adenylyltransferase n=1 Tax=Sulfurospirillum sp. UCH001 TaxID=1581011 RepID=UPI000836D6C5|nr:ThiF family adenylyltransferase [Sulfurospirillum sp. UCH001]
MSILQKLKIKYELRGSVSFIPSLHNPNFVEFFKSNTRISLKLYLDRKLKELVQFLDGTKELHELINELDIDQDKAFGFIQYLEDNCLIQTNDISLLIEKHKWNHVLNFLADYIKYDELMTRFSQLQNSHVVIVGLGAVGSWTAIQLAKTGIQHFVLVDLDKVDISNLNRSFFSEEHINEYKTYSIRKQLLEINNKIKCDEKNILMTSPEQIEKIIINIKSQNIVVINCADNPNVDITASLVHQACIKYKIPYIIAGGYNLHLTLIGPSIIPFETACFDCIQFQLNFNDPVDEIINSRKLVRPNRNIGNIASTSIISSTFVVNETLKILLKSKKLYPTMTNRRGTINFFDNDIKFTNFFKMPTCKSCATDSKILNLDHFINLLYKEISNIENIALIDNKLCFDKNIYMDLELVIDSLKKMNYNLSNFHKINLEYLHLSNQALKQYEMLLSNTYLRQNA